MEEIGAYWMLISVLWVENGDTEENIDNLRRIFRLFHRKKTRILWGKIQSKFIISNGIITHKRIQKELQRIEKYRLTKKKAGEKGAQKRWQSHKKENGTSIVLPIAKNSSSTSEVEHVVLPSRADPHCSTISQSEADEIARKRLLEMKAEDGL